MSRGSFIRNVAPPLLAALSLAPSCGDSGPECDPFTVYSQNRYPEYGAKGRSGPSIESEHVTSFYPNERLRAIGYVAVDEPAIPHNPEEVQGFNWLLVETDEGRLFVSDAALRAEPTEPFTSGDSPDGDPDEVHGKLVRLQSDCELTVEEARELQDEQ